MATDLKVGERVDSVYGMEHRGTIVDISKCSDCGGIRYHVERDADGFVYIALPFETTRLISLN